MWLEEASSLSMTFSLGLGWALWPVKTIVRLFTLSEPSMLTSRVDRHFIRAGMALWTSFFLPRRPNTEVFSCECDELGNSSLDLILVKTEGLDCVLIFNLQKIEGLNILFFPTLLNTEVRPCEVEDYSLLNTKDFGLFLTSSSSLSVVSFAAMYWTRYCLSLCRPEIRIGWGGA